MYGDHGYILHLVWKMTMYWDCVRSWSSSSSLSNPQIHSDFFYALLGGRYSLEFITVTNSWYSIVLSKINLALSPGDCQILSHSCRDELGDGMDHCYVCHRLKMVDSVSTNQVHITYEPSPLFLALDVAMIPGFLPTKFLRLHTRLAIEEWLLCFLRRTRDSVCNK